MYLKNMMPIIVNVKAADQGRQCWRSSRAYSFFKDFVVKYDLKLQRVICNNVFKNILY